MRRQFINLVLGCHKTRSFDLHRIKSSSLFHPKQGNGCIKPQQTQVEEAQLAKPALSFGVLTHNDNCMNGSSMFLPFGSSSEQTLSIDQNGNVLAYDACLNNVRVMPRLQGCMTNPITFNVHDALYLLERCPSKFDQPCFQVLKHGDPPEDVYVVPRWHWRSLPHPPYVDAPEYQPSFNSEISSSTLVGDNIWVSAKGIGTYTFDTVKRAWSKAGSWELPFYGSAEYVSELNLWFGFSAGQENKFFCASDLSASAPKLCHVLKKELAANGEDWELLDSLLVHVGNGRFCIARFYHVYAEEEYPIATEKFAVFTGVEVEHCKAGGGIQMVKHKSIRYEIDSLVSHWVF